MPRPSSSLGTASSASRDALDVILHDGTTLRLRSPRADDAAAFVEFLNVLSEQSLYYRFHGHPTVTEQLVEPFLEPDWHEAGHLVGEIGGWVIALASYVRLRDPPSSVAVLGASRRRESIGGLLFRNIITGEFEGVAYLVNPAGDAVAGVRGCRSVEELPETSDLAVVCLPARHVLGGVEDALRRGTRAFCVISAGFAEVGDEGSKRQDELLALIRSHGGRLVGPNCLGVAASAPHLNATFGPRALPPGPVNPVIASPDGCVAVDARVRVRRAEAGTRMKTW